MVRLWAEASTEDLKDVGNVILPIGALEQHGPHMPVGTDSYLLHAVLSSLVKEDTEEDYYVLPPIPYGKSTEHMSFPGTVTLSMQTLCSIITDIASSLAAHKVKRLFIINGHGGNIGAIDSLLYDIRYEKKIECYAFHLGKIYPLLDEHGGLPWSMHAGYAETSIIMAYDDGRFSKNLEKNPGVLKSKGYDFFQSLGPVSYGWMTEDISEKGFIGNPGMASKEAGEHLIAGIVGYLLSAFKEIVGKRRGE